MRRLPLLLVLLAVVAPPAAARAELPVGYVGPTYFTDVAKGGPTWNYRATGATVPVDPSVYGVDPDASGNGSWSFSDADNAQGTLSPGIGFWPDGFTPLPTDVNSRAVMGTSPAFMLAVQRTFRADDFVVFVLDFAGDDRLAGRYFTCGPGAVEPNPEHPRPYDAAHGYYGGPVYTEGTIALKRSSVTTALAAPPASEEQYGAFGSVGGESPYCDQARATASLWNASPPPPSPTDDDRRATQTEVTCNRGPDPGDPFACVATVGDKDQRGGAVAPSGTVQLTATSGTLSTPICSLAASPGSPATATCSFVYANPAVGAGDAVPVTAAYQGSATHKPSSGGPKQVVPDPKQPDTDDGPPIVCGPSPLPACEGQIDPPGPVQTCVANVGGSCADLSQQRRPDQPAPIKVCIANVISACAGFTGGAVYKGELKETGTTMDVECYADLFSDTPDYAACRSTITLTTEQAAIVKEYDTLLRNEILLRYAVWDAASKRATVIEHPERYTVGDVSNLSLQRTIREYDERARASNALVDALEKQDRTQLGVAHLPNIDLDTHLSTFDLYAKAPDGNLFYDPRVTSPSQFKPSKKAKKASASAAKKRRLVKGYGPKRKTKPTGVLVIARSKTVQQQPGQRATVAVPLNKLGRAVVRDARAHGRKTVTIGTHISMTSPAGRFAPTVVSKTVKAKLTPVKKKKPARKTKTKG